MTWQGRRSTSWTSDWKSPDGMGYNTPTSHAYVKLSGNEQLIKLLQAALLHQPESKVRRAIVKGAQPIVDEAKRLAGRANKFQKTGVLVDSIRVLRKWNRDPHGVYVGPVYKRRRGANSGDGKRPKGEFGNAWYAHFVEYGTNKHSLNAKLKYVTGASRAQRAAGLGDKVHPGSDPVPFMRPAYDTMANKSINMIMDELDKLIVDYLLKNG